MYIEFLPYIDSVGMQNGWTYLAGADKRQYCCLIKHRLTLL